MQEDQMPTVARVGSYTLIQIIEIETVSGAKDGILPKSKISKIKRFWSSSTSRSEEKTK
jgi:hypothetical protein